MSTKEIAGKTIEFDQDEHMTNIDDWSTEIAEFLAKEVGLESLNDRHWAVINFMRKVFTEEGDAPSIRRLTKESGVPTKELYQLFPKGPAKKAAKIAGLPKPTGCI
ncbi:TusE/DsrC/DsvC family sulfur relay protein [candidate division KSB1 bacterium]